MNREEQRIQEINHILAQDLTDEDRKKYIIERNNLIRKILRDDTL